MSSLRNFLISPIGPGEWRWPSHNFLTLGVVLEDTDPTALTGIR